MRGKGKAYYISIGGMLTALAAILQSAPIFLSGIGLFLSPLSTLPIALATNMTPSIGILVYIASIIMLYTISPQEALIMLFTTGALGVTLGLNHFRYKSVFHSALIPAVVLFLGIVLLIYIVGVPVFGAVTFILPKNLMILIIFLFSFFYSLIWVVTFRNLVRYFNK